MSVKEHLVSVKWVQLVAGASLFELEYGRRLMLWAALKIEKRSEKVDQSEEKSYRSRAVIIGSIKFTAKFEWQMRHPCPDII